MDHTRGFRRGGTGAYRPSTCFLLATREITLQTQDSIRHPDHREQPGFVLTNGREQLDPLLWFKLVQFGLNLGIQNQSLDRCHDLFEFRPAVRGREHLLVGVEYVDHGFGCQQMQIGELTLSVHEYFAPTHHFSRCNDRAKILEQLDLWLERLVESGLFLQAGKTPINRFEVSNRQLCFDDFDVSLWVEVIVDMDDARGAKGPHDVADGADITDVGQELVPKTFTFASSFDQTGDVNECDCRWGDLLRLEHFRQRFEATVGNRNDPGVRIDSRERIVGGQNPGVGQRVEQRRLANVRQTDDPDRKTHRRGRLGPVSAYVATVPMMRRIAVIGAGSWGTTVASLAARSVPTVLWARRNELSIAINETAQNADYLPGHRLPKLLEATSDLKTAVLGADALVIAVPSHGFRDVFKRIAPSISSNTPIISLTKGIEQETLATMTEVVISEAPDHDPSRVGVLTGPNLASEVIANQPTATVIAMRDPHTARSIQDVLMGPTFRVYTNDDVVGSELGGAIKNVMAIAAGMSDGLGFGDNSRAALITRALAEVTRLGVTLGGRPTTFAGLAGMGDLIATCSSERSRNHFVGTRLAEGKSLDDVVAEMKMVAEGIKTTTSVLGLAARAEVEMPIAEHVSQVLHEGVHPRDAVLSLMSRGAKSEH